MSPAFRKALMTHKWVPGPHRFSRLPSPTLPPPCILMPHGFTLPHVSWTHATLYPRVDRYGPCVSGPGCLISEAIATDINGLQIRNLHDVDATVGKTSNALWTDGLHGYHIGGNKG